MTTSPIRVWPGVVIVALQWFLRFGLPVFAPDAVPVAFIGSAVCVVLFMVWWLFFSRAPWLERVAALVLIPAVMFGTWFLLHPSIATGAMGLLFPVLAIPTVCLTFVLWAAAARHLPPGTRRAAMVAAIVVGAGMWLLVKTGGFTADFKNDLSWRWTPTPEQRLLVEVPMPPAPAPQPVAVTPTPIPKQADAPPAPEPELPIVWAGFRGPHRDGIAPGVHIETDWSAAPPVKLWERPIGPGWSSFAVQGDFLYTQEQRGPEEVVACYRLSTGQPVWAHRDGARFWESNGGAGPRSTPTLAGSRVYTFGATGIVNALDARTGSRLWSRNAAADTQTKVPMWGFSSSPLVFENLVVVAASGRLAAYDKDTGEPRWLGPRSGGGYSSPHLYVKEGVPQVLLLTGSGAVSVAPADGKLLWQHEWKGVPIVQPATLDDGTLLITTSENAVGAGVRRIAVSREAGGWRVEERWSSAGLKPYFNDYVIHKGHAYGFDGAILSCVDLNDGKRKWKGGRYGHGQMVLLPDQDLLLVVSEEGELALVKALPDHFTEVARAPGIEGKTWNHPVVIGNVLVARNGEHMAAFRLGRPER